ncbi:hypothetical protein FEM48_Zijuj03G0199200 [Ziziphus jujuba var. spinosa]|uniref:Reverse transcriptase Ty1/copia-type domain-containing protein n=1 Tax=Ziziphus jujuba var. spinosa TaxID=714518 RepID=A0A978VSB1_ZIZJJ|nr:hypothetical protein FEM48_Zijuj03G0199200 [Ziziphus jujuba var. spinosa]
MAGDDEQPPSLPPKMEMNSPFFLGTGDRPGDFITPTRLHGDNYDDWASDIQLALEARRKFKFLEGTITGPQPPYTQFDWNIEHLKQRYAMVNGPRIQQLKTSIAKYERVRLAKIVTEDKPAKVLGFAIRTGAGRGRGKTERPVCSHCKKTGHESSTCWSLVACPHCHKHGHDKNHCYEIVGYPEGWSDQNKADGGAGRSRQQAGRGRGSARANAASSTVGASSTKIPDDRLNGKFDTKSWIIDTGATHHVTGDLSWLFDTMVLFECPVGLPNGESVVATQSGSVRLSDKITLKNDHTRELIGMGVRRDGLDYLGGAEGDSVQHVSVHNAASTLELSHKTMGHPSEKVVKLLPPVSNLKGSLNKACEICFRAKHPRDKFPLSDNKATRIFKKIHCDLWGPYKHVSSCGARFFFNYCDKFASRSRKCVFLGYPFGKKGWKLFDLDKKELYVSRDVKFFEDVFPFGNPGAVNIIPDNIVPTVNVGIDSDFADFVDDDADLPNPQAQTQNPYLIQPEPQAHQDPASHFDTDLDLGLREGGPAHTEASSAPQTEASSASLSPGPEAVSTIELDSHGLDNTSNGQSAPMGKGMRDKFPSVLLRDFVTHTVVAESPSLATPSPQHPSAIISSNDPKSFKEAMKDVVYVDDLIISGNDSAALKTFKAYLSDCFKMKDLGALKYFLGIEVARS